MRQRVLGPTLALLTLGAGLLAARRVDAVREARSASLEATPTDHGVEAQDVVLRSAVGSDLHAWWVPAATSSAPAVLVLHGYASHAGDLLPIAPLLHGAGLHALLLDVRGHGRSASAAQTARPPQFAEDARTALAWLHARSDVTAVGLVGHSMGGSVAIAVAAGEPRVRAVVAVAAVASPLLTRIGWWPASLSRALLATVARRQGVDPSRTFAVHRIGEVDAPVLLLHGDRDRVVPLAHLSALAAARPDATTTIVEGAGHASFEAFAPAMGQALAFLRQHLC